MKETKEIINPNQIKIQDINLIKINYKSEKAYVTIPVLYPNGSTTIITIKSDSKHHYTISDDGNAYFIAETMGIKDTFLESATKTASNLGVNFIENHFVLKQIPFNRIEGAMIYVANASAISIYRCTI